MLQITAKDSAVYTVQERIAHMGPEEIDFLKAQVHQSLRKRVRLCIHKNSDERLQEMLIVASNESYIRPSQHVGKDESIHIVEGTADLVFFDEDGKITQVIALGEVSSGRCFYCRTPSCVYHTLLIRSPFLIFHEATQGPFQRSDTIFPSWAPAEENVVEVQKYRASLVREVDRFQL